MSAEYILTADATTSVNTLLEMKTNEVVQTMLQIGVLACDAYVENPKAPPNQLIVRGNSTEKALLLMAVNGGINASKAQQEYKLIDRLFFPRSGSLRAHYAVSVNLRIWYVL